MTLAPSLPADPAPLRAVLVGLGERGEAWLPVLTGPGAAALGVLPVAVHDPDPERALEALARAGHLLPVASDLGQALALAPDLVIDCSSPHARPALVREALAAGTSVLCEPPLAAREEAALSLLGAAARGPGRLCVAYEARHRPELRQLRLLVEARTLGQPRSLRAEMRGINATLASAMLRGPAAQALDAARVILGCDALAVRCTARGTDRVDLDALFEMADGSTFAFNGRAGRDEPASRQQETWRLVFDRGSADWDGEAPVRAWTSAAAGSAPLDLPALAPRASERLGALEAAVMALRAGRPPETGPRDAAASLAMGLAALRSAERNGRPEPVHPLGLMSDGSALPPRRFRRAALSPEAP